MVPLLAALQLLRNDLTIIYADFERIEAHLKGCAAGYGQRLSDLKAHVGDMDRHLEEVLAHAGNDGQEPLACGADRCPQRRRMAAQRSSFLLTEENPRWYPNFKAK